MSKDFFNYELIQKTKASINVDCIKVCPFNKNLFAFAYYQQTESFLGGISLQHYSSNKQQKQTKLIQKFQIFQCGPVLHICWLNRIINEKYILIGASRSQKIFIFSIKKDQINQQNYKINLQKQIHIQKNVFCLYVDSCINQGQSQFTVIVSTNQSQVFQMNISIQNYQLLECKKYNKHQYAVWTCRLNPFSSQNLFVCGDQVNSIYLYDRKQKKLIEKNSNAHQQGICDLTFISQWKLFSGGFDGFANQFDMRNFKLPVKTHKLGGTIWRVIPDESNKNLLICNSSEKKFQIIDIKQGNQQWNSKQQHTSLAYSADWSQNLLLTSSFYDQIVCLWKKQQNIQQNYSIIKN